jgi:plasmid stabilization system protein ParE
MYTILLSFNAEEDIQKATKWYYKQLVGLDFKFYDDLNKSLKHIQKNPLQNNFYRYHKTVRKKNLFVFPYKILYMIDSNTVKIVAVIHHKRSIRYIRRRLK